MPGWTTLRNLVRCEFDQSKEEGRDAAAVDALMPEWERAGDDEARLRDLWRRILEIPIRDDFPFHEPTGLDAIRAARPVAKQRRFTIPADRGWLEDRMYGAWLGRCAGCALGKPVEAFMDTHNGVRSRDRIKRYLTAISPDEWPLCDYIPARSPATNKVGNLSWSRSTREQLAFMELDDDICYTAVGLTVLERYGKRFTSEHVAHTWLSMLPYRYTCGCETMAYRNLVNRYEFHRGVPSGIDWHWVATNDNPYREWIGAQIRADPWGYAAPGNPELAAEFAWRDAIVDHVKNGVYGEMYVAAMIAAAFALDDTRAVVEAGLAEIPATSRLHHDIRRTIELCERHGCDDAAFENVFDGIEDMLGSYSSAHTINNAALVTAALLLGKRDYHKVVTLAVMGGWDTDCNGATAGSICGAMIGATNIPRKWSAPLNDTLRLELANFHPIAISACARRSVDVALKD